MVAAFLPLGSELVLTCRVCGAQSSDSLAGADGWTVGQLESHIYQGSHKVLFDLCPCCTPKKRRIRP